MLTICSDGMNQSRVRYDEAELLSRMDNRIWEKSSVCCVRRIGTDEIIRAAFQRTGCKSIRSVILRGSRATGRDNPYSDVDLLILSDDENRKIGASFKDKEGVRYSFQVFDMQETETVMVPIYRYFYAMKPIYDPQGDGQRLTDKINAAERLICEGIEKENNKYRDYLFRLSDYLDKTDPVTSAFVRAKILREFPAFLAAYNGFNLIGFKHTIDCLIRDNRELAMLYACALSRNAGKPEIDKLLESAFDGLCGLDVLNADFCKSEKSFQISIAGESMYRMYTRYADFMEMINSLKPADIEAVDFYLECRTQVPKVFERLSGVLYS